jgi:hypothetical protein
MNGAEVASSSVGDIHHTTGQDEYISIRVITMSHRLAIDLPAATKRSLLH